MLDTTINHLHPASRHRGSGHVTLPAGLETVDRLLRSTEYPEPDGWQAVEAVVVALAGREGVLVKAGGPLAGLDPYLLHDPRHRALWWAYERVRAAGDDVADLDVLGATLDVADPGGVLEYVTALWGVWPSSLGVNVKRARDLLEDRAEAERELERVTEHARARGVLPKLSVVPTPQPEAVEAVSENAVRGKEPRTRTPQPRPPATTTTDDAGESPASGGDDAEWCPRPVNKVLVDRYHGTLSTVPVACLKRGCEWCGPRWVQLHVESVESVLDDRPVWVATVERAGWDTLRKRYDRQLEGWDYKRVPIPDTDTVLVLSTVELPGAEPVATDDVRDVLESALSAVRHVDGARVSASTEWSVAAYRRADPAPERTVEYLGDLTVPLANFVEMLGWWRVACELRVLEGGAQGVHVTGMTPARFDRLLANGVVRHPAAVAEDRAARKRERYRRQLAALRAACPWWWPTVEAVDRAA